MGRRYALRDDQWERIKDMLPGRGGHVGVTPRDNQLFVEAVLYRYRAGIPWRDLPDRFADFRVVHLRHSRWSQAGVWKRIFKTLSQDPDNEYVMIDSTIVRAHQHNSGAKRGPRKSKLYTMVDALGYPTAFHLTPKPAYDLEGADVLLKVTAAVAVLARAGVTSMTIISRYQTGLECRVEQVA